MTRPNDIASENRRNNLPSNGEPQNQTRITTARWNDEDTNDWRVSLSVPNTAEFRGNGPLLRPLKELGNKMVFPYTPNIYVTHTANYEQMSPVHTNWPFQIYQNSSVDQMTITGDFTAENEIEARFWVACSHYLRSVTKMSYGDQSPNRGAPPPVVRLNGYGDFVFNDIPVVVLQYNMNLPADIDYIKTTVDDNGNTSWVPIDSEISVTVQPTYSRDDVNSFDLRKFVTDGYLSSDTGWI